MAVCAMASKKAGGYPVKWVETRSEHMTSSAHGNEPTFRDTRVEMDRNGVITAIGSRHIDDCGAYPRYEPLGCVIWSQVVPGVYRFKNARIDFSQAVTNKCPVGPNRGYSRMQHLWFLERVIDICAHELGIPGDEMRLRNYIRPEEFPYTTPNGCVYDSGNYPKMLQVAKDRIGWDDWKRKQAAARQDGRLIGIGIGRNVHTGASGTYASQFAVSGLSAVHGAAQKLKTEMKRLGAFLLETSEKNLEFGAGQQGPEIRRKDNGQAVNYWRLANVVNV